MPKIVGITGGSCSGKTTLEGRLIERLGERVALFPFDDMFVGLRALHNRTITDWEDPTLYRWEDFLGHLRALKAGQPATISARSRESTTAGIRERNIMPRQFVVVAGFLALHHPKVRRLYDTTIYLDLPEEEIVRRRLARAKPSDPWDSWEYIRTALIPGHRRVVLPQRRLAQHRLDASLPPDQLADRAAAIILA